ncbi:MAG TPA: Hpt domain-containing protein [Planctomycetota bacterium]|nr:Hpt domain-containing protein [Planctomycetota bacterium]
MHQEAVDSGRLSELAQLGGDAFVDEVVAAFLRDGEQRFAALRTAAERGDAAAWTREAHTLKSAAAGVGADGLRRLLQAVEHAGVDGRPYPAADVALAAAEWSRVRTWFARRPRPRGAV